MASFYTHHHVGQEVLHNLPRKLLELAQSYQNLYLFGHQGPDLFFFQISSQVKGKENLGTKIHDRPFVDLLDRLRHILNQDTLDPPSWSYVLGLCGHFYLDATIHPLVNSMAKKDLGHIAIEGELDRYYLEKDGHDINKLIQKNLLPDPRFAKDISLVYAPYGATKDDIKLAMRDFARVKKIFQPKSRLKEGLSLGALKVLGLYDRFQDQVLRQKPLEGSQETTRALVPLIDKAIKEIPSFTQAIYQGLLDGSPWPDLAYKDFNGEAHELYQA